jgi:MazG family protein
LSRVHDHSSISQTKRILISLAMTEKIYDEAFTTSGDVVEKFSDFVSIVRQLRRDCPWDREQSHESIKHLLIEEAYETVEAIEDGDADALKKELGDLFLHVVFHAVMASELGTFDLRDVITAETDKLIRRHPHVFGDTSVGGVDDVLKNWESIKIREGEKKSAMEGVPRHLPTLLQAFRIQEKAAGVGFDFETAEDAWGKVEEELSEFMSAREAGAPVSDQEDELGDFLFAVVNFARLSGLNPENALGSTNSKFIRRFRHIEDRLTENGSSIVDASLPEMDAFWNEAKTIERGGRRD